MLIGMQRCVLGDTNHREDLLKMGFESEGLNDLAALAGCDHHLNNERDAA